MVLVEVSGGGRTGIGYTYGDVSVAVLVESKLAELVRGADAMTLPAGSWGFEAGTYDLSLACGEQSLLPAVRAADRDTIVVADGFSCSTQIAAAGTGRTALHTAEVMALASARNRDDQSYRWSTGT